MAESRWETMSREELLAALAMFAKNWLAHDGCWFQAAERRFGLAEAIRLDADAWGAFATAEARRILTGFGIAAGGGLHALEQALGLRMYALINRQHCQWLDGGKRLRFVMDRCRVQETRRRKGLPDFPCRPVGEVEFASFATAVDPRIRVSCVHCPPDAPPGGACAWDFTLAEGAAASVAEPREAGHD
jgi:hypothetical protein